MSAEVVGPPMGRGPTTTTATDPCVSMHQDTEFSARQASRDRLAYLHEQPGDDCRRWSTCDQCQAASPEMTDLWEQEAWETSHIFDCAAPRINRAEWDFDLGWPPVQAPMYTRRLEPAVKREHITVRNALQVTGWVPHGAVLPTATHTEGEAA